MAVPFVFKHGAVQKSYLELPEPLLDFLGTRADDIRPYKDRAKSCIRAIFLNPKSNLKQGLDFNLVSF